MPRKTITDDLTEEMCEAITEFVRDTPASSIWLRGYFSGRGVPKGATMTLKVQKIQVHAEFDAPEDKKA